jgi:hypothetical protein
MLIKKHLKSKFIANETLEPEHLGTVRGLGSAGRVRSQDALVSNHILLTSESL